MMRSTMRRIDKVQRARCALSLLVIVLLATISLAAADSAAVKDQATKLVPDRDRPQPGLKTRERPIQVDVNVVLVNVTVADPLNRLVTGLDKEHFQLFEDKA